MTEYLAIRLAENLADDAEWVALDETGSLRGPVNQGNLSEAAEQATDRRVILLVPGTCVLTTTVDIPVKGARLAAALPYALEEQLADDVDHLHFAAGSAREDGQVPVSVVSHELMAAWLETLDAAGITPQKIVPDTYGLSMIPGTFSMLASGERVIINDGKSLELAMQGVSPGDALAVVGAYSTEFSKDEAEDQVAPRHLQVYCDAETEERYQHDWLAAGHELAGVDVKILGDGPTARLAATVAAGSGVNLLQGKYGVQTNYMQLIRPWKVAAMLLLALGVIGFGGRAAEVILIDREVDTLRSQFLAEYQTIAPGAELPRDPAAVLSSLMARAGSDQSPQVFMQAVEELARAVSQNQSARLEAISFRAGVVDVRLSAPDVPTLDRIQRIVSETGRFSATIQSTDQSGERVSSRIQIQAAGA